MPARGGVRCGEGWGGFSAARVAGSHGRSGFRRARCLKSNPCGGCRIRRKVSRVSGGAAAGPGGSAGILEVFPRFRQGFQSLWRGCRKSGRVRRDSGRVPGIAGTSPESLLKGPGRRKPGGVSRIETRGKGLLVFLCLRGDASGITSIWRSAGRGGRFPR